MTTFHKTTWANVRAGDTVLMAWASLGRIVEVEILDCASVAGIDGKLLIIDGKLLIAAAFKLDGVRYARTFDLGETAYVQSRF